MIMWLKRSIQSINKPNDKPCLYLVGQTKTNPFLYLEGQSIPGTYSPRSSPTRHVTGQSFGPWRSIYTWNVSSSV